MIYTTTFNFNNTQGLFGLNYCTSTSTSPLICSKTGSISLFQRIVSNYYDRYINSKSSISNSNSNGLLSNMSRIFGLDLYNIDSLNSSLYIGEIPNKYINTIQWYI